MTRDRFPGGWYCDATPSGRFCVALRGQQRIVTHQGEIDTAPRDLLFTRCAYVGAFRVAGQEGDRPGHQGDGNYEYPPGARVGASISVSPVLYDLAGTLRQAQASHQGFRYEDHATGRIYTGDETYGPFHGLFEYSEAGDGVYVGQAAYDGGGVQVWDGTALRQLELGDCRFIRVQWDGEAVAIAFTTPDAAVIWQTTRAELRALPPVETPEPEPQPPEPTPEPPEPTPEPPDPEPTPEPPRQPYTPHQEYTTMADTLGVLRGPGGRLARPDGPNTAPWAAPGWRGIVFDGTDATDARYHFVRRGTALISHETGSVIGCDATLHSGGLNQQFYLKPDGDTAQGWAEEWQFYDGNANGAIEAQVEYAPGRGGDDGAFFSYPLAFEVVA